VMRRVWGLIERVGIAGARNVAAVCGTTEKLLKKDYGLSKTATVLNVPEKSDYAAAADGRFRARLGIAAGTPLVVYKGDIAENRGLLAFLHAMVPFETLSCAMVGGGAYRETLKAAAKELGLLARVFFVDPVSSAEFAHVLKDADVGQVLHEGRGINMAITLPSKLFDYINAGIPVIASDGPEVARIVREWNIGWVVRPASKESMQKGIADFLAAFPDLAEYKKNCAKAAERYRWDVEKKAYVAFITDALGARETQQ
jgi:glycosyltransferase involved in cell wall biosynthesis